MACGRAVQVRCGRCGRGLFAIAADLSAILYARDDMRKRSDAVGGRIVDVLAKSPRTAVEMFETGELEGVLVAAGADGLAVRHASDVPAIVETGDGRMVLRCTRPGCECREVLPYRTFGERVADARQDGTFCVAVG